MLKLSENIGDHRQLFEFSCIPYAVELILKLLGRVPIDYYDLQRQWDNRKDGDAGQFNGATVAGVAFRAEFYPPKRSAAFPFDQLFSRIERELKEERYVIVSLQTDEGNWHNHVIYGKDEKGCYLVFPAYKHDVEATIRAMEGTDILTYRIQD